jgi:phosphate transport system protein
MATSHYEASLERDIQRLRVKITEMAGRAEKSLRDGIVALMAGNRQLAYSITLRDTFIDALDREIDRLSLEFIIRQQPVGVHLRFAAGVIKVNLEIERIGDYAKSIAKQALKISRIGELVAPASFQAHADAAIPLVREAVEAFCTADVERARRVVAAAPACERMRSRISEELFQARQDGKIPLEAYDPLITIARRFERVADQAKNIAEETIFVTTGEYAKHARGAVLRVIFIDNANAGASQMAEAVGQSIEDPRFIFSSAGIDPKPIDRGLIEFLGTKGIDISRAKPRRYTQVPNLEHYQVFIALTPEACAAFPPPNARTVNLEWHLPDPAAGERLGTAAAYEETWQVLSSQIHDLVKALLGEQANAESQ